jgi:hypothetical protein
MRISTINGKETGIGNTDTATCNIRYDRKSKALVCRGLAADADVTVLNFGGVKVAHAAGSDVVLSLASQPQGSYIAVIKSAGTVRTHKFIKW